MNTGFNRDPADQTIADHCPLLMQNPREGRARYRPIHRPAQGRYGYRPRYGDQAGLLAPSASSQDSELAMSTTQTSERPSHTVE